MAAAALALAHCSCISTAIDRSTNKHRSVLKEGKSREEIRRKVGKPMENWEKSGKQKPAYEVEGASAYDVFEVRGVVARPGDGAAQATASAITLGAGEAITLPFTVVGVAAKPFITQTLVVLYDEKFDYRDHLIFDSKGRSIHKSGY